MRKLILCLLLMAPAAFGVCKLPIVASYTFNGIPADADSVRYRVYNYYDGTVLYNVAAAMDSFYANLVNVDSAGSYRVITTVYGNGQRLMSEYTANANCTGTPVSLTLSALSTSLDSVLNAVKDANKVNFGRWSAAQRDSILNAITATNKVNFGRWSAAQRDSILNAIADANKSNFGGGSVVISQADIDSIVAGVIAGTSASNGTGIYALTIYARDTINSAFVQGINLTAIAGATTLYATTNNSGYATFNVDSATWTINALGSPYTWVPFTRGVGANTTDTITGGGLSFATPGSPDEATVYGTLISGDGSVAANWDIRFTLEDVKQNAADTSTGQIIVIKTIDGSTNGSGYFSQGLMKTDNILYKSGTSYKHPVWKMVASPSDLKTDIRLEMTFGIPADSTSLDLGLLIKQGAQ